VELPKAFLESNQSIEKPVAVDVFLYGQLTFLPALGTVKNQMLSVITFEINSGRKLRIDKVRIRIRF